MFFILRQSSDVILQLALGTIFLLLSTNMVVIY